MPNRAVLALLVAAVLALAGAASALWSEAAPSFQLAESGQPLFPALATAGVDPTGLDVEAPGYTLNLEKSGDGWVARSNGDYPAKTALATDLIAHVAAMRPIEAKTREPDWYRWIGVEDRSAEGARSRLLRLKAAGKELAEVLVGRISTSLGADLIGGTFVRVPGQAQAWLVSGITDVPAGLTDWFEPLFNIAGTDVAAITISQGGKPVLEADKANPQSPYGLKSVDPAFSAEGTVLSDELMRRIAGVLVSNSFEQVRKADGLTIAPDDRKVTFRTVNGLLLDAEIVKVGDVPWVVFMAQAPQGGPAAQIAADITRRTRGWAFQLPQAKMIALLTKVEDLLSTQRPVPPPNAPGQIFTDPAQLGLPQTGRAPGQ